MALQIMIITVIILFYHSVIVFRGEVGFAAMSDTFNFSKRPFVDRMHHLHPRFENIREYSDQVRDLL